MCWSWGAYAATKLKPFSNENNTLTPTWQPFLSRHHRLIEPRITLDGRTTLSVMQGRGLKDENMRCYIKWTSSATAYL